MQLSKEGKHMLSVKSVDDFFASIVITMKTVDVLISSVTASPRTYLSYDTLKTLGVDYTEKDATTYGVKVKIQGIPHTVFLSQGHFEDIDVLGQDFLRAAKLQLTVRTASLTATLERE